MRDSRMAGQKNSKVVSFIRVVLAVAVTLIILFPVYWMVVSSLKTQAEMRLAVPTLWPETFSWGNYAEAFRVIPYAKYFSNTLIMSIGLIILQLRSEERRVGKKSKDRQSMYHYNIHRQHIRN